MAILSLNGVTKQFQLPDGESIKVLRGVDLSVDSGEAVAIVGRSGSGKSTLLNVLGLLDRPTSGQHRCDGIDTAGLSDLQLSRLRGSFVGFVFQQFLLLDRRTALENVAEPMLFADSGSRSVRVGRAQELLEMVDLTHRAGSMPHLMSGGEKQRVAIARALVRSPRLLLADEPTGSLDTETGEQVIEILLDLTRSRNTALVLVTHDLAVAAKADRILHLSDGILQERAT